MVQINSDLQDAMLAVKEGRNDDALRLVLGRYGALCRDEARARRSEFLTMFLWGELVQEYPPARDAMVHARDVLVRRLLDGEESKRGDRWPRSLFQLIVEMNETLNETRATYELFLQMELSMPALVRDRGRLAFPAMLDAGDFARAARYLPPDPLAWLEDLNACDLPIYSATCAAPRLVGNLLGLLQGVRQHVAVLQGTGREAEADALCNAALTGIVSDEMRALAQRELAVPGTVQALRPGDRNFYVVS